MNPNDSSPPVPPRKPHTADLDGLDPNGLLEVALDTVQPAQSSDGGAATVALPAEGAARTGPHERHGGTIGRYKLLERIGEGGFGTVWVAEQQQPVRRRVALKIIKLGMDTEEVIARFEQERQALAMMDHPNIAKVLDAGTTQWGRPYFVMELVRGIPITMYCDDNKLATPERLSLFGAVCHAIQHAHQKGIIHRDIKPSNVLVTVQDGEPVPKVIDFGIAKATQGRLTDKTIFTEYTQMIGTPLYMSPEQAEMSALDIDTRSDIYSLGVLLYELLVGRTPFESESLMKAGLDEMRRVIREQEPPKPSTALQTMPAEKRTTAAAHRRMDWTKMAGLLRGDLDWIVMKALEKDRTRRYETASGFAEDIRRYLANEPVTAAAPSAAYRLRKFARRNKVLFAAGSTVALTLIAGVAVSSWQVARATRAELRARRAQVTAEDSAKQAKDALQKLSDEEKWRKDALIQAEAQRKVALDQKAEADIQRQAAQRATDDLKVANTNLETEKTNLKTEKKKTEDALEKAKQQKEEADRQRAKAEEGSRNIAGEKEKADRARDRAIAARKAADVIIGFMQYELRDKVRTLGRLDIVSTIDERIERYHKEFPPDDPSGFREQGVMELGRGDVLLSRGDRPGAIKEYQKSKESLERSSNANPGDKLCRRNLGLSYIRLGHALAADTEVKGAEDRYRGSLKDAQRWYRNGIEVFEGLAKADPGVEPQRDLAVSYAGYADALKKAGNVEEALRWWNRVNEIFKRLAVETPGARAQHDLSVSYGALGDLSLARREFSQALDHFRKHSALAKSLATQDPDQSEFQRDLSVSYHRLAGAYEKLGDLPSALVNARASSQIDERLSARDPANATWREDLRRSRQRVEKLSQKMKEPE